jgi:hypothetical protein
MNDVSSRSHAILTITIDQYDPNLISDPVDIDDQSGLLPQKLKKQGAQRIRSKIHLVDLAGSERADATGATGQR